MINQRSASITIGIPFYNAADTLLDAVRSVFAQTHSNWELILLDDGSTDRSLEIARSINDLRVRVYSDGQNKRLAARLNEMVGLARYEFMARMDADDLMAPTRLERQLEILLANPKVDLVSTGLCSLRDDYEPVGLRGVGPNHLIRPHGLLRGQSGIVHASIVGRRNWFERNPYKENLVNSEDTNLWVRAYARNDLNVAFIEEPLYFYREDNNVSKKKLLLAYQVGRQTILHDTNNRFTFGDKASAFMSTVGKSIAVHILDRTGRLDWLRARRNRVELSSADKFRLSGEIALIRGLDLPLKDPSG